MEREDGLGFSKAETESLPHFLLAIFALKMMKINYFTFRALFKGAEISEDCVGVSKYNKDTDNEDKDT